MAIMLTLFLATMTLIAIPTSAQPSEVWVDDDFTSETPGWGITHFDNIQDGVNAVVMGGTVHVAAGTYYEHVSVGKPLILLGEDRETTIIDGGGTGNVVFVTADHVEINEFTVQNGGGGYFYYRGYWPGESGIFLGESSYCEIMDCDVRNSGNGLQLFYRSKYNMIENCKVYSNDFNGILLDVGAWYNVISNCDVWSNSHEGISLWGGGRDNTISNCNAYSNIRSGIGIHHYSYIDIENCNAWNNGYAGIGFDSSSHCTVENSEAYSNQIGILIYSWGPARYHTITGCNIYSNTHGILAYDPIAPGGYNRIYHNNFVDNAYQAVDDQHYPNTWDDDAGRGNYWSDYVGVDLHSGPNQDEPGFDGIGDTPYEILGAAGSRDRYPILIQLPHLYDLKAEISDLDVTNFENEKAAARQREVLCKQVNTAIRQVDADANTGAINTLENVKDKIEKWINDPPKTELINKVNLIISILETL